MSFPKRPTGHISYLISLTDDLANMNTFVRPLLLWSFFLFLRSLSLPKVFICEEGNPSRFPGSSSRLHSLGWVDPITSNKQSHQRQWNGTIMCALYRICYTYLVIGVSFPHWLWRSKQPLFEVPSGGGCIVAFSQQSEKNKIKIKLKHILHCWEWGSGLRFGQRIPSSHPWGPLKKRSQLNYAWILYPQQL